MVSMSQVLTLFLAGIPKVIGFLLIGIVGWIIAGLLATAVASILRSVKFNELATSSGLSDFVRGTGVDTDPAGFMALITKWFVRLITLVVAFDALGLPAVSDVLRQLLLWLPNLAVALVVLVLGGLAANAVSGIVRASSSRAELGNPDFLARVAQVAVWAFAIVIAVNQLGVATTLVNTLFMAVVGSLALALGLAFGLGGRETAAQMVRDWHERVREAQPEIEKAAKVAGEEMRKRVPDGVRKTPH